MTKKEVIDVLEKYITECEIEEYTEVVPHEHEAVRAAIEYLEESMRAEDDRK